MAQVHIHKPHVCDAEEEYQTKGNSILITVRLKSIPGLPTPFGTIQTIFQSNEFIKLSSS